MATTMKLSDLMLAVRQRADMVPNGYTPALTGDYFVTEPELISYINQSYFELYDLLVTKYGDNYFVKTPPPTIVTDGTNDQYDLPADFYKLLGLDLSLDAGRNSWVTLRPFQFGERNRFSLPNSQNFYGRSNLRYRINGNSLWLTPFPDGGQTIRIWHVPRLMPLAALTETVDGISGWTEYVIVDATIKCKQKQEDDVMVLMAQKQALIQRIEAAAENRDAGAPARVTDVTATGGRGWGGGFGDGWEDD